MRSSRWLPALLAVAIAASGLGVVLTRDSEPDQTGRSAADAVRPALKSPRSGTAADGPGGKTGFRGTGSDRTAASSELEPESLGEPARAGQARTDPGTLIVRFREGTSVAEMEEAVRAAGAEPRSTIPALNTVVAAMDEADREKTKAQLEQNSSVEAVDANGLRYASVDPNDPGVYDQLHILVSRLPIAWEVTKGSTSLDLAILDTGVDLDHPDLDSRIVPGRDIVNNDNTAMDDEGHGTMVAGIAAAETNNGMGVAGAAWNARIMPVKVLDSEGAGTDGDIADGIVWAVDHGAEVINLSLGGPGSSSVLEDAVEWATSHGVVVVAAAGNEATSEPSYPAAIPNVVAVGATDPAGDLVSFSNFGSWVDLVAPGTDIISTRLAAGPTEDYGIGDGTSFSAPIVAGVALLVKARNPTWTPAQIAARLRSSASDRGPDGIDDSYGYGLLDAYAAVGGRTAASPPIPPGDALEPNDVSDRATVVTTPVEGTIAPEGDVDWYAVDVPAAGSVSLTVTPPSLNGFFGFDPVIEAFSPDLRSLGAIDDDALGIAETLSFTTAGAGRYSIRVSNYAGSREPASYTVTSSFTAGASGGPGGEQLWVKSVDPAQFSAVAGNVQPSITFARELEPSSVTTSNVRLLNGTTGAVVAATPTYDAGTRTVTLAPSQALTSGPYIVDVRNVTDIGAVAMSTPFRSHFTVITPAASPAKAADFNRDGYDDVAVGSPAEDIGSKKNAGVMNVIYGSATGSKTTGTQLWHQDTPGVPGVAEAGDMFGSSIATGDVNNDGYDDLAVGAPGEDIGSIVDGGAVHLFLGSPSGLKATGSQIWEQNTPGILDTSEKSDKFGAALTFGNFDNVAGSDLAIGVPGERVGTAGGAGAVHILSGRSSGLTAIGTRLWTQTNIYGFDVPSASFGAALAAGDFDGDTHDDLAIGAPGEDLNYNNQGTVTLMHGTIVGLKPIGALWSELLGVQAAANERFGASLTSADFGGLADPDGYADLAIGVPGAGGGAGRVDVLFSDWLGAGSVVKTVRQTGNGNQPESGDGFGSALASGRFAGSSTAWLGIGVPGEDFGSFTDAGVVHVVAPKTWLTSTPSVPAPISQDSTNVPGVAQTGDRFGSALRLLDVDNDGAPDAVVGSPTEARGSRAAGGGLHVIRKSHPGGSLSGRYFYQGHNGVSGPAEAGDRFGASIGG